MKQKTSLLLLILIFIFWTVLLVMALRPPDYTDDFEYKPNNLPEIEEEESAMAVKI